MDERWIWSSCRDMSTIDVTLESSAVCFSLIDGVGVMRLASLATWTAERAMLVISGLELALLEGVFLGLELVKVFCLVVMRSIAS